jgi:hypothetical protein
MFSGFWERIVEILGQAYKATTYHLITYHLTYHLSKNHSISVFDHGTSV